MGEIAEEETEPCQRFFRRMKKKGGSEETLLQLLNWEVKKLFYNYSTGEPAMPCMYVSWWRPTLVEGVCVTTINLPS